MEVNIEEIDEQNNPSKIYLPKNYKNYYKIIPSQQNYRTRKNYNTYQNIKNLKQNNLIKSNLKTVSSDGEFRPKYNFDYLNQKIGKLYLLANSMHRKQTNQIISNYSVNQNPNHFQKYKSYTPLKNLISSSVICENKNQKNMYNYSKKDNNFNNNTDYNCPIFHNRYKSSRNNNKNIFFFNNIRSKYINYNKSNDVRHSSSANKINSKFISHSPVGRFDHYFVSSSIKQRQIKSNNVSNNTAQIKKQKQNKVYNIKNFQIQNNSNFFFGSKNDDKLTIEKNNIKIHKENKDVNNKIKEIPIQKKETYENDDNNYFNLNNFKSVTVNNLIRESYSNNEDKYQKNNLNENNNVFNLDENDEITFKDTKNNNNNKNITKDVVNDYINVNNIEKPKNIKSNFLNSMLEYENRIVNTENNEDSSNIKKILNNENFEIILQYNSENNITNLILNDNKGKKINFIPIPLTDKLNDNNNKSNKKNVLSNNIIKNVCNIYSNSNKLNNNNFMQLNEIKSRLTKKYVKKKLDYNKINRNKYPPPVSSKRKKNESKEKGLTFSKCSPKKYNNIDKSCENKNMINFNNFIKKKNRYAGLKNNGGRSMSTGEKSGDIVKKNETYTEEVKRKKALKNLEKFFAENPIEEENNMGNGNNKNLFRKNHSIFKIDKLLK